MNAWMSIARFIRGAARNHATVEGEALALIASYGDNAYYSARNIGRAFRENGDFLQAKHWSTVAVFIAEKQGITIGEKAADRYEREQKKTPTSGA